MRYSENCRRCTLSSKPDSQASAATRFVPLGQPSLVSLSLPWAIAFRPQAQVRPAVLVNVMAAARSRVVRGKMSLE